MSSDTPVKVFLIHGMFRSRVSLLFLRARLARLGFDPRLFGYAVSRESFASIVSRFVDHITTVVSKGEPYAIVTHSLGGIVTRAATPRLPAGLSGVVMLGPPNKPPVMARKLSGNPLFSVLASDAGRHLLDAAFYQDLPAPDAPTLVVAGNSGPRAKWLPFAGEPSDGVVTVDETRLAGAEHREIPVLHTFMVTNPLASRIAGEFLESRRADLRSAGRR